MVIACPKCGWRPRKGLRWRCECGCQWDTFQTHGVCPQCGRKWQQTQCGRCATWSPHEAWYHADGTDAEQTERTRGTDKGI